MIKFIKDLYLRTIAFLCNISPYMLELIREKNIRGKGLIGKYLTLNKKEIIAECNGITYSLNLNDDVQLPIYMNSYEKKNIKFVLNLLEPGHVFFDAGANVGAYTLQVAKRLNSGKNIYAFEPEPNNFKRLENNCMLNEFSKNVNRYELALTNFKGTAALFQSEQNHSGWHSLTEFKDISMGIIEVKTSTLDSFINENDIPRVDLIKIDVEANEFELLEGAGQSLKERILKKIYIEFNGTRLAEKNKTFKDLVNLFGNYGYFYRLINTDEAIKLLDGKLKQIGFCDNFLFIPDN